MKPLVFLPKIIVKVDGIPLDKGDERALSGVRVQQRLSLPNLCELTFNAPEGPLTDAAEPLIGASLLVAVEGHSELLFAGQITAVEFDYSSSGGRRVYVRGYDLLHQLCKRQPVRAHVQMNVMELAQALVEDLGLDVEAVDPGPVRQKIVQHRQSDLELLIEVAERCGLYFTLRNQTLHLLTLEGLNDTLPLVLGSSLLEAQIEINSDSACQSVQATGWNPGNAEQNQGSAGSPRVGRQVSTEVTADKVGGSGERLLVDELLHDSLQAEAIAQAELDRRVSREITLRGVAEGDPNLRPGVPVKLSGVAKGVEGRYVLSEVIHIIDRHRGFVSEINTAPPKPLNISKSTLATVGRVTQVDDPEKLGRVKAVLTNYAEVETDWLEVVVPGAGMGKGIVALPDVDDQVMVLLIQEDPANGVVLGGLYGVNGPPDSGVEDGAVRRYSFLTPGGQKMSFDDTKKTVRIENSKGDFVRLSPGRARVGNCDGSFIDLTPKLCRIHAETDLEIEAPGKSVVIRGQLINFERG
jgi:phage baseplate assembly protein gpV